MPLDPQARAYMDALIASNAPPVHLLTVEEARLGIDDIIPLGAPPEPVASIADHHIPGPGGPVPIRIYTPVASGLIPVIAYFHGGGWVVGTFAAFDTICRTLANASHCIVVAIAYPLAPEHSFPAAPEACYAATRWISAHAGTFGGDGQRIAVAGDSAGGNLAAAVALMARDRGTPSLRYQVLICPVTDHYSANHPSYSEHGAGYYLTRDDMRWFWDHYLTTAEDANNPYASPLRAQDLHALPPALIITAEFDPLRDEGELYAQRLRAAHIPVTTTRYPGMMHAFINMTGILPQGLQALAQVGAELRNALFTSSSINTPEPYSSPSNQARRQKPDLR